MERGRKGRRKAATGENKYGEVLTTVKPRWRCSLLYFSFLVSSEIVHYKNWARGIAIHGITDHFCET